MKKLIVTIALISGITLSSQAAGTASLNHGGGKEWGIFKEVVKTFRTENGKFQNMSTEEQNSFLAAADAIKAHLAGIENEHAIEKAKHIDLAENVFRFVWCSKPEFVEADLNMEVPAAPGTEEIIL